MKYLFILVCIELFFAVIVINNNSKKIDPSTIQSVELIKIAHPYLGKKVDSRFLNNTLIPQFIKDFSRKKSVIAKFYGIYLIKIRYKNGKTACYRTDGEYFEKFEDETEKDVYFRSNNNVNFLIKYWGIPKDSISSPTKEN